MVRYSGIQGIFQSSSRSNSHCTHCLSYTRVFPNIPGENLGKRGPTQAPSQSDQEVGKVEPTALP